jgi:CPA2 family monovalent cation:H+ antiporter-2
MFFEQFFDLSFFSSNNLHNGYFTLPDVLIILFFAIFVVLIFKKIKLSPVIGYIFTGAIIGPYGLELTGYNDVTKSLAEFGVVFLLFSIGLELTLERLMAMKHLIFGLGLLQFLLSTATIGGVSYLITGEITLSIIIGASLALSSTAIILKLLSETHQANSKTGKISLSILLLQDIAVIPLFVLIPLLNNADISWSNVIFDMSIKSVIAILAIILFGRFFLKPILHVIAASRYNDIFVAAILLVVLSAAWVTKEMGLSLAFGAFMAGVMIAETQYQLKTKATIAPFKGLFLGFFFITEIGMHFDIMLIIENFALIALLTFALISLKVVLTTILCLVFRNRIGISLNSALLISQTGEFAFILFELASKQGIMNDMTFQNLSLVVGLSMAVTPFLAHFGKKIEQHCNNKKYNNLKQVKIPNAQNKVIIAGFGRVGQTIAKILDKENISYIAIDYDAPLVAKHFEDSSPIYFGSILNMDLLKSIEVNQFTTIMLALSDQKMLNQAVKTLSLYFPETTLVVRAVDMEHAKKLQGLGAKIIVPEMQELGLQMSKRLLNIIGEDEDNINKAISLFREQELEYSKKY